MELSYIKPSKATLELNSVGRSYTLRLINLEDESWIKETYGEKLAEALDDGNELCRIIYRLIEDRSDFRLQEVTIIDEEGNESVEKIGGYKLLKRMIIGLEDKIAMINGFNQVLGVSRPINEDSEDEDEEDEESDKKKV